jgi:hypothetical protein
MQKDPAKYLQDWIGKEIRVTTVGNLDFDGMLESPGHTLFSILHKGEPMLIAWSAVVTVRRLLPPPKAHNARKGERAPR